MGNEFLEVRHRHDGCTTSIIGSEASLGDRREILDRIERSFCSAGADRKGEGRDQQRMAVGRRLGDGRRPDRAAGAGAIVDDHGLPPALGEPLRDQARDVVGGAARHERNDQLDLLGRIGLRRSRCSDDKDARDNKSAGPN